VDKNHIVFGNSKIYLLIITLFFQLISSGNCLADRFGISDAYYDPGKITVGGIIFTIIMLFAFWKFPRIVIAVMFFLPGAALFLKGGVGIVFGLPMFVFGFWLCGGFSFFRSNFKSEPERSTSSRCGASLDPAEKFQFKESKALPAEDTQAKEIEAPDIERIKAARVTLKKTQESVAKMLGVTHAKYSRWESGLEHPLPDSREKLWKLIDLAERRARDGKTQWIQ
jgi:DNA-binding transcriptional regulator YiaG